MDERKMDGRVPLKEVVADCTRRWFQDSLREAKAGDAAMQVLVGQMYQNGYGVSKDEQKANAWITKASKYRSSVWKVIMPVTRILKRRRLTSNHERNGLVHKIRCQCINTQLFTFLQRLLDSKE